MKILTALKQRFVGTSGEELGQEIDRLADELNTARNLTLREDVQREVDQTLRFWAEHYTAELGKQVNALRSPDNMRREVFEQHAIGVVISSSAFAEACAAAVASDSRYSDVTPAERAATVAQLEREIGEHEAELERREFDQQAKEREVRLQAKLEAIASKANGKDAA